MLYLIAAVIVAAAILASELIATARSRRMQKVSEKIIETAEHNAEKTARAAENARLVAEARKRTAEINAKIEELKLERTRLLQNLSETDKEAFEKLLNAPLIEKTEVKTVPLPYPIPCWYPGWYPTRF